MVLRSSRLPASRDGDEGKPNGSEHRTRSHSRTESQETELAARVEELRRKHKSCKQPTTVRHGRPLRPTTDGDYTCTVSLHLNVMAFYSDEKRLCVLQANTQLQTTLSVNVGDENVRPHVELHVATTNGSIMI